MPEETLIIQDNDLDTKDSLNDQSLRQLVAKSLEDYFANLEGQAPSGVFDLVIREVEIGLLSTVMQYARGNQSKAATWLGLARGTLRKKLSTYNLED